MEAVCRSWAQQQGLDEVLDSAAYTVFMHSMAELSWFSAGEAYFRSKSPMFCMLLELFQLRIRGLRHEIAGVGDQHVARCLFGER